MSGAVLSLNLPRSGLTDTLLALYSAVAVAALVLTGGLYMYLAALGMPDMIVLLAYGFFVAATAAARALAQTADCMTYPAHEVNSAAYVPSSFAFLLEFCVLMALSRAMESFRRDVKAQGKQPSAVGYQAALGLLSTALLLSPVFLFTGADEHKKASAMGGIGLLVGVGLLALLLHEVWEKVSDGEPLLSL